jgi:prophage antirepressor-like protein
MENQLAVFDNKPIRRIEHEGDIYFSIVDIIGVLTEAAQPRTYWSKLKKKITDESQLLPIWKQLKLKSEDGKSYQTDCVTTEGVLRVLMSVPSPKAEPFKLWLADVGKQAIVETENPELGFERMVELYKAKGRTDEWIKRRVQSIETRKELTDEWKNRGVKEGQDYAILTATIAKGTFGLTPSEHKKLKGLEKPSHELRDHMTPLELIFTALSEEITRQIVVRDDAQGFHENHEAAQKGGSAAGNSRRLAEKQTGLKVISNENFLSLKGSEPTTKLPK